MRGQAPRRGSERQTQRLEASVRCDQSRGRGELGYQGLGGLESCSGEGEAMGPLHRLTRVGGVAPWRGQFVQNHERINSRVHERNGGSLIGLKVKVMWRTRHSRAWVQGFPPHIISGT